MVLLLVAALVVSNVDDAQASESDPLAGCHVADETAASLDLECPGATLRVRERAAGSGGDFARGVVYGFKKSAPQPVREESGRVVIDGTARTVTRLPSADGRVLLVLSEERPSRARIVTCQSVRGAEPRCELLLDVTWPWTTAEGAPRSVPRRIEPKTFAGRRVEVPGACHASGSAAAPSLECEDGTSVSWTPVNVDGARVLDEMLALGRKQGLVAGEEACTVDGTEAACKVLRNPAGGPPRIIAAEASVRGTRMLVVCLDFRAAPGVPAVCSTILSFPTARGSGAGDAETAPLAR